MSDGLQPPIQGGTSDAQILDAIGTLNKTMTESAEKSAKGLASMEAELEKMRPLQEQVAELQRQGRHRLSDGNPLDDEKMEAMDKMGGWRSLGLRKAVTLPTNHAMLRGTDADHLKDLQDYHDGCVFKFWIKMHKYGQSQGLDTVRESMCKDEDFLTYVALRERAGMGKAADLMGAMKKGFYRAQYDGGPITKANEIMHPDSGGAGVNLDFTLLSAQLIQKMRLDVVVAAQFPRVPLTRSSQKVPSQSSDAMGVWGGGSQQRIPPRDASNPFNQSPNFTAPNMYSQLAFGFTQFDVEHLLVYMIWNDDMEEDSIIPWVPMMRDQAAYGAARALDRAILDGDETATHRDTDVTASNDFRKSMYGLRKMVTAYDLDGGSVVFDLDDLHTLRASLGIYGKDPSKVRIFMPLKVWYQLVGNTAASSSGDILRRVDTIGTRASVLNGQVAEPYGMPLIISEFVRTDTDATGVNGATGNTQSLVIIAHSDRFAVGQFNEMRIETTRYAPVLTNLIQSDVRVDFQPWDQNMLTSGSFSGSLADIPANVMFNND